MTEEQAQRGWEKKERVKISATIAVFAEEMKDVMFENLCKSGWEDMNPADIYDRLRDELEEFHLKVHDYYSEGLGRKDIAHEAIDIANYAMFVWYWATKK